MTRAVFDLRDAVAVLGLLGLALLTAAAALTDVRLGLALPGTFLLALSVWKLR